MITSSSPMSDFFVLKVLVSERNFNLHSAKGPQDFTCVRWPETNITNTYAHHLYYTFS